MIDLKTYFFQAVSKKASDIHLVGDEIPMIRVEGELIPIDHAPLNNKELENSIETFIGKEKYDLFMAEKEYDFSTQEGETRFRINLHRQQQKIGVSIRLIPTEIPGPFQLSFEPVLYQFSKLQEGLVLVSGPTGCGKSTTIACMIEEINKNRKAHIVTIEDPVEFSFKSKKCLIEQRDVGTDTHSFADALKYVLRQDPNIIFIGEMRDPETISMALTAAETGHLVFSTLHSPSAAESIERIVDVFEGGKQKQILMQLSVVLKGVIAQRLVPTSKGNRVPVREILVQTPGIANLIRENKIPSIKSTIQTSARDGMITMENSFQQWLNKGIVAHQLAGMKV